VALVPGGGGIVEGKVGDKTVGATIGSFPMPVVAVR